MEIEGESREEQSEHKETQQGEETRENLEHPETLSEEIASSLQIEQIRVTRGFVRKIIDRLTKSKKVR